MGSAISNLLSPLRDAIGKSRIWETRLGWRVKPLLRRYLGQYAKNVYGPHILWEFPVQLCCRDFVRPGDAVLDVGANIGGLSVALSRLVGPTGSVHAFEANPQTLLRLQDDLADNDARNVRVVNRAAWHTSHEKLSFYCDNSYYSAESSLTCRDPSWRKVTVKTISLDDYCAENVLRPSLIKLDVEGAEHAVLQGSRRLLADDPPVIIFEYSAKCSPSEDPGLFLQAHGWTLYDVYLYRQVDRQFYLDRFDPLPLVNIVAIPPGGSPRADYAAACLTLQRRMNFLGGTQQTEPISLALPGRYLLAAKLDGQHGIQGTLKLLGDDGEVLAWIACAYEHLCDHSCANLLVETDRRRNVVCEVVSQQPGAIVLQELCVSRVDVPRDIDRVSTSRAA